MNHFQRNKWILLVSLGFFVLIFFLLSNFSKGEDLQLIQGDVVSIDEGWTIQYEDKTLENVSFPIDLNLAAGVPYEASTTLPLTFDEGSHLLLRSSMQNIAVYVDGNNIFSIEKRDEGRLIIPLASVWLLVDLPREAEGKELKLVMDSPVSAFSGVINKVLLAPPHLLLYEILRTQVVGVLVFMLLFFSGLAMLILSFFTKKSEDNRLLYLGLLGIVTGLWILSEARVLQFFTGNRFIIGSISYLMIPLMGGFLTLYIRDAVLVVKSHKKLMQGIAYIFLFLFVIEIALQIGGISPYIESLYVILPFIFIIAVLSLIVMFSEFIHQKNENVKRIFKYYSVIGVGLLGEGIVFFIEQFDFTSQFFRVSIFIVFVLLLRDYYQYFQFNMDKQKEKAVLEKLAYKDLLTGGLNRTAFHRDLKKWLDDPAKKFRLIIIDLNDLKHINDKYGHIHGDRAIQKVYGHMEEAFRDFGRCYRIGGDEFVILIEDKQERYKQSIQSLRNALKKEQETLPYRLNMAIGEDLYEPDKWDSYIHFYHHVDQKMYQDKKKRKQPQ